MATEIAEGLQSVLTLNDGIAMPLFGLGVWQLTGNEVVDCIKIAFKHGYRLIDTASYYRNEKEVGEAVRNSGLKREEIFVVSKLWHTDHGYEESKNAFRGSLQRLGLDYVDLFLIHTPGGGQLVDTYKALVELKAENLIRSVGVSNFGVQHLEGLRNAGLPTPSVNQLQLNAYCDYPELVKYCRDNSIAIMGYSPLVKGQKMNDPDLLAMAKKYNKSIGQFLIGWSIQNGFITIPKSSKPERIAENADVFDFSISEEDMKIISNWPRFMCAWNPTNSPWEG
eukprot:GHVU01109432.1.p1 GENE.GHVU01109432.1~~GHVU01109432.1.p1  ORF type:complete len:281 (+),score=23.86 GHVU01109432.1:199-1041(+)